MARNYQAAEQIVGRVGLQLAHGQLRAGEDNRLAEVLQHEGERGAGVGETVGAVQDDEAVEEGVVVVDGAGDARPALCRYRAGVQQSGEFEDGVADASGVDAGWGAQAVDGFSGGWWYWLCRGED